MKIQVRPELAMIAVWLPPATLTDMHSPAPPMIRPESTYKRRVLFKRPGPLLLFTLRWLKNMRSLMTHVYCCVLSQHIRIMLSPTRTTRHWVQETVDG